MKKTLSLIIVGCLVAAFGLTTACGSSSSQTTTAAETTAAETTAAETTTAATVGGYTVNTDVTACTVPDDAKNALAKATEGLTSTYDAISLLGTQVVAGTNYMLLCKVTDGSNVNINVVTVYEDLQGNCELLGEKEIDLAALSDSEDSAGADTEQLEGGWTVNEDAAAGSSIDSEAQSAFDKAMEGLTGAGYEPIAVLGTQVVSGTNYAILCKGTMTDQNATNFLAVVFVNADLQGNASIIKIVDFNLADYTDN